MSQVTGATKPSASQKAKPLLANESGLGQGVRNIMSQLAKKASWAEQKTARICGKEHLKDPIAVFAKALKCLENPFWCGLLVCSLLLPVVVVAMACRILGAIFLQNQWEGAYWEGVWPCLEPWDVVRLRTSSSYWNVPENYGPHSELFFFFVKKEPVALTKAVSFKPLFLWGPLKACALIGLRILAAEGEARSCGSQSPVS